MAPRSRRSWSPPRVPWVLWQSWTDLVFLHWPIAPVVMETLVPRGLPVDRWDGQAWLGVVPFRIEGLRPRALPGIPTASTFPELNVRTYVRVADKPGVFFFSLDAASLVAVTAARTTLGLNYRYATMSCDSRDGRVRYDSRRHGRPAAAFHGSYAPVGPAAETAPGSLEEWLVERYCLYTRIAGRWMRLDIDHAPWTLQAAEVTIETNTMAEPLGITLGAPTFAHFAGRQEVIAWPPVPASRN